LANTLDKDLPLKIGGLEFKPGSRIGSYVYDAMIGEGGMAHVIQARSPDGRDVALKILKASRFKTGLTRFKREFRALSRINHPNVINVESYGDIHNHPFIAMEYVEGIDLHQTIREFPRDENKEARWERCEEILVDICRGLAHVHQRGLVHRDLKPSNIMVTNEGHAKISDFGIVKDLDSRNDPFASRTLVGTWAYASPEQIQGSPLDHRSDLYSLGIILFAMLTGRRPFSARDMMGYRKAHLEVQPPTARDLDQDVPAHLNDICNHLLAKNPRDRFQSALEILYRLEQLEEGENIGSVDDWEPPLTGRKSEYAKVQRIVNGLTQSRGGVITVSGGSGVGTSRLLQEAITIAKSIGIKHTFIKDIRDTTGLPVITKLSKSIAKELDERCPESLKVALSQWSAADQRGVDSSYQLLDAMTEGIFLLLDDGPRLLVVDDFHLSSARELQLLGAMSRKLVNNDAAFLTIIGYREDKTTSALTRFLSLDRLGTKPTQIELQALDEFDTSRLIESLLGVGKKADVLAKRLQEETEGNLFFISQFLQSLLSLGTLIPNRRGRWHLAADVEEIATGHLKIPASIRKLVRRRIEMLTGDELAALQVLAVANQPLEIDILIEILNVDEDDVLDRLDPLIERKIIKEQRNNALVQHHIPHKLVQELVYRDLQPQLRSSLHYEVARSIEQRITTVQSAADIVGEHYRLAGEAGKAFSYLARAAETLWKQSLLYDAWKISDKAMALADLAKVDLPVSKIEGLRMILFRLRADVHYGRGEWDDCKKNLSNLLEIAERQDDKYMMVAGQLELGRVYTRLGLMVESEELLKKAQSSAKKIGAQEEVVEVYFELAAVAWERGKLDECRSLAEEGLVLAVGESMRKPRGELLLALTAVQAFNGQIKEAAAGIDEAQAILRQIGHKRLSCVALCNLAEIYVWQGRLALAHVKAREALELARELDYRIGRANAVRMIGEVLMEVGRFDEAERQLRQGLSQANRMKLDPEIIAARHDLARLSTILDDPEKAEEHAKVAKAVADRRDPEQYLPGLFAISAWSCAKSGDYSDGKRMLKVAEKSIDKLPVPRRCQILLMSARTHRVIGDEEMAIKIATKAAGISDRMGFALQNLEALCFLAESTSGEGARGEWVDGANTLITKISKELDPSDSNAFTQRFPLLS